ncbi:MAG: right-handed parallel beta-helix repeat-containing protein [Phycisphaerales bacterium]|nr:MAG: right-handed parallel beta-helix repeat-containing protein [Phycisphaerales bacterium]
MNKRSLTTAVVASAIIGAAPLCGALWAASAYTNTYLFVPDQSHVVQTGGFAGIRETYTIEGQFQLSIDPDAGTASFDWVSATLGESGFLSTRSLGMLFNMTKLTGTVINDARIEFKGTSSVDTEVAITIVVTVVGDSARLTGDITPPCCDRFNFDLDAVAQKEPGGWVYRYFDDFDTDKAREDSYIHSLFWPAGAFPPPEPYLHYDGPEGSRGLVFVDYRGEPAHLGYCLPLGPAQGLRAVRGSLEIDVLFPRNADVSQSPPGYLLYSASADGLTWSTPELLSRGYNNIPIASLRGTCYVIFFGTRVVIDNVEVHLYSPAATVRVPEDFETIQEAIDVAANGDVVEVAPGVYAGPGNRDIEFRGKAITVRSANGPEETVIDCAEPSSTGAIQHRGCYFHEAEKSNTVLRGFTIRGGKISGSEVPPDNTPWDPDPANPVGGGIYCEYSSPTIINCVVKDCGAEVGGGIGCVGSAPTIVDCAVEGCTAGGFGSSRSGGRGGGIGLIRDCNAKISNCIIRGNSGYYNSHGGGIYCRQSSAVINDCDISSNKAPGNIEGGGLYCAGRSSRMILQNCIISHNAADAGAGVFTERGSSNVGGPETASLPCQVRVTNCTVAHNRLSGPQMPVFPGGGIHSVGCDIVIKNSIVWYNEGTPISLTNPLSNSPVLYSDIERGYLGPGNIGDEPLFAPTAVPDYHLQSIYGRFNPASGMWATDNVHSPCIDAGDPHDPTGHEPFPNGKRINMGAYGGSRQASKGIGHLVFHVDGANGDDSNSGLSRAKPFATIQRGISSARDGDTVVVWPGVYEEEVNFDGKAIAVQSAADAAVVVASRGYAFSFFRGEDSKSILRNFVIRDSEYGIFCEGASPTVSNLTIVNNVFGIAAYGGADPNITDCILWDNASGDLFQSDARHSYVGGRGHDDTLGSIDRDPLFADPANGDYHLRSRYGRYWPAHDVWVIDRVTSPCIDAGDPSVYPERERMPHGGRLNMGAYGGTPYASMSAWPLRADVNEDGVVNVRDFAIVADTWLDALPWAPRELSNVDIVMPVDGTVVPMPEARPISDAPATRLRLQGR